MSTLKLSTPEATFAAGEGLGRVVQGGDVIALVGDLGAGKTVLVQGLARGAGVPERVPVTSPTFTLVNEYRGGRLTVFHVDLYRIEKESELEDLGLDDLFRQDAVVAVEWADRVPGALLADRLELRLAFRSETERELTIVPHGERARALAQAWSPQ